MTAKNKTEINFDFDGLIKLLAEHLYSEKRVFVRELIQNAHDAIQRRAHTDEDFSASGNGRIEIISNLVEEPYHVIFRDNGAGMTRNDIEQYLSSIGASGTLAVGKDDQVPDLIGQFGIGFLSGFVVASRIEVRTRHFREKKSSNGWLWKNEGRKDYTLEPCDFSHVGTEIRIDLGHVGDRGLIQDSALRETVRYYADMLRVPIYLNRGEAPANTRFMPWERTYSSDEEKNLEYRLYLEKIVPDSVLEVIPLHIDEKEPAIRAAGLLYITNYKQIAGTAPRTIRLFHKRMFVCENTPEVFPEWATFVNGIFNTSDLVPNAARDNFVREENYDFLRNKLGKVIVAHLKNLRIANPARLSNILRYHEIAIKSFCNLSEECFDIFADLLEWRVNKESPSAKATAPNSYRDAEDEGNGDHARVTLPDIIAALPNPGNDKPKNLPCFTTSSSANQFFEMANAAKSTVVDASHVLGSSLLKAWVRRHATEVKLVHIDQEDEPDWYKEIDPMADRSVNELANRMSLSIRADGVFRVQVEARRFEPASLTAVIKSAGDSDAWDKAESLINDPNTPSDLRHLAEEVIRGRRNENRQMIINSTNPLIRKIAELLGEVGPEDDDVLELMLGIFNDAILYNQELMTPRNAKIFHQQFGRLMTRNAHFVSRKASMERYLEEQRAEKEKRVPGRMHRKHLVAFLMTPFSDEFDVAREGVRIAVEDRLGCELRSADKKTFDLFIHENVFAHIDDADFYIADITDGNPNVMLELGAVLHRADRPPIILMNRVDSSDGKINSPTDIRSAIAMVYRKEMTAQEIAEEFRIEMEKSESLRLILDPEDRERILSVNFLIETVGHWLQNPETCGILCKHFPSVSSWATATDDDIAKHLDERDTLLAPAIRARVVEASETN